MQSFVAGIVTQITTYAAGYENPLPYRCVIKEGRGLLGSAWTTLQTLQKQKSDRHTQSKRKETVQIYAKKCYVLEETKAKKYKHCDHFLGLSCLVTLRTDLVLLCIFLSRRY